MLRKCNINKNNKKKGSELRMKKCKTELESMTRKKKTFSIEIWLQQKLNIQTMIFGWVKEKTKHKTFKLLNYSNRT